jgi:hypothetical protein
MGVLEPAFREASRGVTQGGCPPRVLKDLDLPVEGNSRHPQTRRSEQSTSASTLGASRRSEADRIETSVVCVCVCNYLIREGERSGLWRRRHLNHSLRWLKSLAVYMSMPHRPLKFCSSSPSPHEVFPLTTQDRSPSSTSSWRRSSSIPPPVPFAAHRRALPCRTAEP